ncbi:MAG TPA: glycine zipper 2TM domain-containing protein [Chromatiales bacterium]|nr:glycine zipper 2TM domain-containing protein [Chromatiales bacterium]
MNKTSWMLAWTAASLLTMPVAGLASDGYVDRARVVSVRPIYETVEVAVPRRECWTGRVVERYSSVPDYGGDTLFPTLIGGALGGYLGNKLGDGRSEAVTTAMGTAIGLAVGQQVGRKHRRHHHYSEPVRVHRERRCRTVEHYETERRLTGYRVKYRYKGRLFETITDHRPGKWISVEVDVDPLDDFILDDD